MRQRLPLTIAAAAIAIIVAFPAAVSATHSWGGYHWARTTPTFALKLGDDVSGLWDGYLVAASGQWSQATVLDTTVVAGGTRPKACRPTSGQVEVCSASYGNSGWLGLAQIWITGGEHIVQGIVKNNDYYFGSSTYQYNNTAEMKHVICQEVGHTFGLDHQSTSGASLGTCMDYYHNTSSNDTKSTTPNQGDYDELTCIYDPTKNGQTISSGGHTCRGTGHLDSFTSVGSASAANAHAAAASAASSWGRLVASSDGGAAQTFLLDLGGGNAVVTFVIWTS
jgi:hypothetical protein